MGRVGGILGKPKITDLEGLGWKWGIEALRHGNLDSPSTSVLENHQKPSENNQKPIENHQKDDEEEKYDVAHDRDG